jgi:4,5-dihydroxyphthalate decarboxylase
MAGKIRFYLREPTIDTIAPIASGAIAIEGFETALVERMDDADAWDCSFATRMLDFESQTDCISVPVFPNRKFRLSYIYVRSGAGIESSQDLHGKRVGIRVWANTAGVWARGALQHHYGVDLARIKWVALAQDASKIPAGALDIEYLNPTSKVRAAVAIAKLDALLLDGDVDAVIDADVIPSITRKDPRVRRLFRAYATEEKNYFKATGIFPISHVMTLRRDFVDRHPSAPVALLEAFRRARDRAFDAIEGSDPQVLVLSWISHHLDEQRALMGDNYFSYDIAHNQVALDAMMRFAHEQWLTSRLVGFEELFEARSAALPEP